MDNKQEDVRPKKSAFEDLNREDLIKKCKGLLNLAKSAKQTKDEYAAENTNLKEQISKYEIQKSADKKSLTTMQEIVDALTEQKLTLTIHSNDMEQQRISMSNQIKVLSDKAGLLDTQSIENESLKRRLDRLNDENEQLLHDLQQSEANCISITEAKDQELAMLEKDNVSVSELQNKYKQLTGLYNDLEKQNRDLVAKNENLATNCSEFQSLQDEHNSLLTKWKSQDTKLKLYKTKLIDFSMQLKQLKACKEILLTTVHDYSQAISKWQSDILSASNEFFAMNRELKLVNVKLTDTLDRVTVENNSQSSIIDNLNSELEFCKEFQNKYNELLCRNQLVIEENQKLNSNINEYQSNLQLKKDNLVYTDVSVGTSDYGSEEDSSDNKSQSECVHCKEATYRLMQLSKITDEHKVALEVNQIEWDKQKHSYVNQLEELKQIDSKNSQAECVKCKEAKDRLIELQKFIDEEKSTQQKYENLLDEKSTTIIEKSAEIEDLMAEIRKINSQSECVSKELAHRLLDLTTLSEEQKAALEVTQIELNMQKQSYENLLEETSRTTIQKSAEFEDLLVEMRQINEALKTRGDTISKQEQRISEMHSEWDKLSARITELEMLCNSKSAENIQLSEQLRDMEKNSLVNDANCEQLSTSTVSRADEIMRMKDIEDSFEEKYNKLRGLAIKLKKKVSDQTKLISELESKNNKNSEVGVEINSKLGATELQVRSLQVLQKENDNLQDQIDAYAIEKKNVATKIEQLQKQMEKLNDELTIAKNSNVDIKNSVESSNKQKLNLDQAIKEYIKQVQSLKDEINEYKSNKSNMELTSAQLRDEVSLKNTEIKLCKEEEAKLTAELAKMKLSVKKTNVLSLEMEAYEKSLAEISTKLDVKNARVLELQVMVHENNTTIELLKNQIKFLEENVNSEKEHSIDLKHEMDLQQSKLKETEQAKVEFKMQNEDLIRLNSVIQLELEEMKLDSIQNISEKDKLVNTLQCKNGEHVQKLIVLEEELSGVKTKLWDTEQELADIKTEFASYKVRAQSMFRQSQTKESSRENELKDEISTIQSTNDNLNIKITSLVEQNSSLNVINDSLSEDKKRLQDRCNELLQLIDASKANADAIQDEFRKHSLEHQEALKSQRLQIETLNSCFKKQISELTEQHANQIKEFQNLNRDENKNRSNANLLAEGQKIKTSFTDEQKIDWVLMERQEGEGSESTHSGFIHRKNSATKHRRDFIPLDELLNNSFDDNALADGSISPTFELQTIKQKLSVQEVR